MTKKVNPDTDEISTSLRIVLEEEFSKESFNSSDSNNEDGEKQQESKPSPTDQTPRGDSEDSPLLEGIDVDTREKSVDEGKSDEKELRETLVFIQEDDITESSPFRPRDEDGEQVFPLKGSGQIDSIFVSSDSNTFRIYLELDGDKIIDSVSWSDLESESTELAHIGAYQKSNGEYVVSVSDYPFSEEVDFSIRPTQQTDFNTIRIEVMLDEYGTGEG